MPQVAHSYPLDAPSDPIPMSATCSEMVSVGVSESPYSKARDVQDWGGQAWALEIQFAPMTRLEAGQWIAFISKLNGPVGSFRYGPVGQPLTGSALGTPLIDGASQVGNRFSTKGWNSSESGLLLPGDFIQVGDQLFAVLDSVDSDGSGNADVTVWPNLRISPDDEAPLITSNPKGVFQILSKETSWTIGLAQFVGLRIAATEVVSAS